MSNEEVEEQLVDTTIDDFPVVDVLEEAFRYLFAVDDRRILNEIISSISEISVFNLSQISVFNWDLWFTNERN